MSLQFTKIICHKINGLLYLALLAGAVLISAGCGGASRSQGNSSLPQPQSDLQLRVINGSVMEYGAVPQLLQLRGIDALGQEFICSAVSLGMGYVLTAGHCVVDVTELQVLRGESTYAVQEV